MKKILFLFSIMAVLISCKNEKTEDTSVLETEEIAVNYQTFGDKITDEDVLNKLEIFEQ